MYKKPQPDIEPINYFTVESITEFLDKIVRLGGKIISPKQDDIGWVAAAADSKGNQFALIETISKKV